MFPVPLLKPLKASEALGYASMLCWLGAQFPQIVANYNNKSADGLSLPFLFNWLLGDLTNFIGCILTDQQPFQIYLSLYFCSVDLCLFFQYFYYRRFYPIEEEVICEDDVLMAEGDSPWRNYHTFPDQGSGSRQRGTIPMFAIFFFILHSASYLLSSSSGLNTSHTSIASSGEYNSATLLEILMSIIGISSLNKEQYTLGRIMAWTCTVLYLTSRMPQIWKNFKRKSVEGLSIYMFIFAALGNLAYTLSILFNEDANEDFYYRELPYILGASGTLTFDAVIYIQCWKYRNNHLKNRIFNLSSISCDDLERNVYLPATYRRRKGRPIAVQT
jgi:uncharacterized protein with PQ loop repeat